MHIWLYSKTCVKRPLKIDKTKIFMINGSLMKVKSMAEFSPWRFLQTTFDLHAIVCLENQFSVFLRVAVLHRFYCIVILVSKYWKWRYDCKDMQADLHLCCLHTTKTGVYLNTAHTHQTHELQFRSQSISIHLKYSYLNPYYGMCETVLLLSVYAHLLLYLCL